VTVVEPRRCTTCILSEATAGISFDAQGRCHYCAAQADEPLPPLMGAGSAAEQRIIQYAWHHARRVRASEPSADAVDCVVMLSGGKDSLMALWYAVKVLELRPLALTIDNGFVADHILDNVRRGTQLLGVRSEVVEARIPDELFAAFLRSDERRRVSLCTFCNQVRGGFYEVVREVVARERVSMIIDGRSKLGGHIGVAIPGLEQQREQIGKFLTSYAEQAEQAEHAELADAVTRGRHAPWLWLSPWLHLRRDLEASLRFLERELGWRAPASSWPGKTSSCDLSLLDGYLCHRYGIPDNPHEHELSLEVRWGESTRETALRRYQAPDVDVRLERLATAFSLRLEDL
jgi:hypothetical protein